MSSIYSYPLALKLILRYGSYDVYRSLGGTSSNLESFEFEFAIGATLGLNINTYGFDFEFCGDGGGPRRLDAGVCLSTCLRND